MAAQWQTVTIAKGAKYRSPAVSGYPQRVVGWCRWYNDLQEELTTRAYPDDNGREWFFVKDFPGAGRFICRTHAKNVRVHSVQKTGEGE